MASKYLVEEDYVQYELRHLISTEAFHSLVQEWSKRFSVNIPYSERNYYFFEKTRHVSEPFSCRTFITNLEINKLAQADGVHDDLMRILELLWCGQHLGRSAQLNVLNIIRKGLWPLITELYENGNTSAESSESVRPATIRFLETADFAEQQSQLFIIHMMDIFSLDTRVVCKKQYGYSMDVLHTTIMCTWYMAGMETSHLKRYTCLLDNEFKHFRFHERCDPLFYSLNNVERETNTDNIIEMALFRMMLVLKCTHDSKKSYVRKLKTFRVFFDKDPYSGIKRKVYDLFVHFSKDLVHEYHDAYVQNLFLRANGTPFDHTIQKR